METASNDNILWVGKFRCGGLWGVVVVALNKHRPEMSTMTGLSYDEACEYVKYFREHRISAPRLA